MTKTSLISGPLPARSRTLASTLRPALAMWIVALSAGTSLAAQARARADTGAVEVYTVNRKVADFPDKEDMSTPEAAYATLNRFSATGDQTFWRRLSVPWKAKGRSDQAMKREVSTDQAAGFLGAKILEVQLWEQTNAVVIAQTPRDIDLRFLTLVEGQWLNDGNDGAPDLEGARARVASIRAYRQAERQRNSRPPVADPEKHLRPFVEFLKREAIDPQEFLLQALAKHRVVILGEVHNRARYWAFNKALVRSPEFRHLVGIIYLEFPINDQPLINQFLAAPTNDPSPVIEMLRDMFEMGWPDQPTVEFCQAVWEVNQTLPKEERLRIELVDIERPWKKIHKREDWREYDVNRNAFMAENILRDLREHDDDKRHALFIVGWMHALKNMTYAGGEPIESAGRHLQVALGETHVLAVFPHCPVISNHGAVNGRLALGLFDSAFAALNNRPLAFPLDHGPFGELLFDASMDFVTTDPYRAGFGAFLYLGPLEDEIMSPLVPGFYTDEFAREVDRRYRLMRGRGLAEVSGASLVQLRSPYWGQPRRSWQELGPLNAWHYGSDWEKKLCEAKHRNALKDSAAIKQAAQRLFDAIRQADYKHPGDWHSFPAPDVDYTVYSDYPGWMQWVCQHFGTNPIVRFELGEVALNSEQMPELSYELTMQNDQTLQGTLPFRWNARLQRWGGVEGLDWHLQK